MVHMIEPTSGGTRVFFPFENDSHKYVHHLLR
jgi:hypothetical protein